MARSPEVIVGVVAGGSNGFGGGSAPKLFGTISRFAVPFRSSNHGWPDPPTPRLDGARRMLILANVLALALIAADEPKTPTAPTLPTLPKIVKPSSGNPEPEELWPLTLAEAIRIGLDNSDVIRVLYNGPPMIMDNCFGGTSYTLVSVKPPPGFDVVIVQLNRDASIWKFKADAMAHVRSIEQTYWALWLHQVALTARESAVKQGEEILRRERAELDFGVGRGGHADVAEAEQQLENFKLNLVAATSDVITTERQLRTILGLPVADNRRIVTATSPTEAKVEPDWETSIREMLASQPDIAQQEALVRLAEMQLILARNQLLPLMGMNTLYELISLGNLLDDAGPVLADLVRRNAARRYPAGMDPSEPGEPEFINRQVVLFVPPPFPCFSGSPLYNTRQVQYRLLRERATLQQIRHQTTHSLARFFLEVDANYKQFRSAQRLRAAAQTRLEAARAQYEEGRLTVDRLLDAMAQSTNAIAQETQYKATYNTSLAALEEAKGTLLTYDKIAVADPSPPRKPYIAAKVDRVETVPALPEPE